MAERDDTPRMRPPGQRRPGSLIMTDTQRALAGAEHRRAETAGIDSESRRARRSAAIPVPIPGPEPIGVPDSGEFEAQSTDDITSPIIILDEEPNDEDREVVARSKRDSGSPMTVEDGAKLLRHFKKHVLKLREDEQSNNKQRSNQLLELLNRPPDEATRKLSERLGELEASTSELKASFRIVRIIVWLVIGSGSGSLLLIADRIWNRAEREGEAAIRLQHVEEAVNRLRDDLRDRRYPPAAERPWLQPPSKEATP